MLIFTYNHRGTASEIYQVSVPVSHVNKYYGQKELKCQHVYCYFHRMLKVR